MNDGSIGLLRRLRQDFEFYASRSLKIRIKGGGVPVQFNPNRAQLFLHQKLEEQRARTGKVRALILKSRQQGASTYIEARFFHRVSMNFGVRAFILTHEQKATDNLFDMADTFYRHLPDEIKPHLGSSNANELVFDRLGSGYSVATAGSKDTGRSATAQLFHGSEAAFWKNAATHMAGIGQIVPNDRGTEIVLETTANGVGNHFHQLWQLAEAGENDYIAIFTPWFWSLEYTADPPAGFVFTSEDREYQGLHGITDGQLYWRRQKINTDFAGDELLFQQEYPATAAEAFVNVGHRPFISPDAVLRARKRTVEPFGARLLGVDPARYGGARTSFVWRQGRKCSRVQAMTGLSTMQVVGLVAREITAGNVDRVFIDVVGLGAGIVDRLHELGHTEMVVPVNAGSKPDEPDKFLNKRAEMWDGMREWFALPEGVQVPDVDELQADVVGPEHTYDSTQKLQIEKKEDMMKRGVRSPDIGDALALTFAYPVSPVFDREMRAVAGGPAPRRPRVTSRDWRAR